MQIFSSNSTHKIDAKGRVSIPASFRKVLDAEPQPGVVLIPRLHGEPAIEGLGYGQFHQMAAALGALNPLERATKALKNKLLGQARHIQLEDTGRIVLGRDLIEMLGNPDTVLFVGLGQSFQIWNPDTYAAAQAEFDQIAYDNYDKVPWNGVGSP